MGVSDRSYMRGRGADTLPLARSWTVIAIVLLVVAYFVDHALEERGDGGLRGFLVLSRPALEQGRVWTLLTSALLHADAWPHLIMNCLGLWFFGRLVEESVGSRRYAWFLLIAAVLSHVPFVVAEFVTGGTTGTIGASGVVMAALVFAAFRFPNLPATFIVVPMRLWQIAVLYVAVDAFQALQRGGSFIDHWTHLGGAAYGFLAHRLGVVPGLARRPPSTPSVRERDEGPYSEAIPARIDALLDKINKGGIGSLSEEEREFLKRHSGRYR